MMKDWLDITNQSRILIIYIVSISSIFLYFFSPIPGINLSWSRVLN